MASPHNTSLKHDTPDTVMSMFLVEKKAPQKSASCSWTVWEEYIQVSKTPDDVWKIDKFVQTDAEFKLRFTIPVSEAKPMSMRETMLEVAKARRESKIAELFYYTTLSQPSQVEKRLISTVYSALHKSSYYQAWLKLLVEVSTLHADTGINLPELLKKLFAKTPDIALRLSGDLITYTQSGEFGALNWSRPWRDTPAWKFDVTVAVLQAVFSAFPAEVVCTLASSNLSHNLLQADFLAALHVHSGPAKICAIRDMCSVFTALGYDHDRICEKLMSRLDFLANSNAAKHIEEYKFTNQLGENLILRLDHSIARQNLLEVLQVLPYDLSIDNIIELLEKKPKAPKKQI